MKKLICHMLLTAALTGAAVRVNGQAPQPLPAPAAPVWESGGLFLKLRPDAGFSLPEYRGGDVETAFSMAPGLAALAQEYHLHSLARAFRTRSADLDRIYLLRFDAAQDEDAFVRDLAALPWAEYAERIPVYSTSFTPNDMGAFVWHLPHIDAPAAWDLCQGSRDVVVAVVDNAVAINHEDLVDQLWTNAGETDGDNIDNDLNGYVDDIHGWDAADEDPNPNPPSNNMDHGTHCSGLAAGSTNNGKGIASMSFNVTLMPVKTKHDTTTGPSLDNTMGGVDYAIVNHADIVSMSFGGDGYSFTWVALLQAGYEQGVLFVAAAGNEGTYDISYPAAYPHVISVGSTDNFDEISGFSSYHPSVDVMAPGSFIYSTVPSSFNNGYSFMSGTSMACPVAAGLCALILSADTSLTPDQIEACLKAGCENISAQNPTVANWIGSGRINALNSLNCVLNPVGRNDGAAITGLRLHTPLPQPAQDFMRLRAEVPRAGFLRLHLRDVQGRDLGEIWSGQVSAGMFEHEMALSDALATGMYLVEWEYEGLRETQKFMVQ